MNQNQNHEQPQSGMNPASTHRLETNYVDYQDGRLCIRYEYSNYTEPKILTMWWGADGGWMSRYDAEQGGLIGKEARSIGNGSYSVKIGEGLAGYWVTLRLPEGGSTKAFKIQERAYPCPKVRKGIEVRYRSGKWQKYLKSEGWVTA